MNKLNLLSLIFIIGCVSGRDTFLSKNYGVRILPSSKALAFTNPIEITDDIIRGYGADIANQINKRSKKESRLFILINSDGGSVSAGRHILNAIEIAKSRGVDITCLSTKAAHSMAFIIFANCSRRYAFRNTPFLIHEARIWLPPVMHPRIKKEKDFYDDYLKIKRINEEFLDFLKDSSGISDKIIRPAFYNERQWTARELEAHTFYGWITIISSVNGYDDIFNYNPSKKLKLKEGK